MDTVAICGHCDTLLDTILHTVDTLYCGHCIVDTVLWTLYCEHCNVDTVLWTLYCGHCIVDTVLWTLYCGQL